MVRIRWTVSNILSLSRIALLVPIVYLLLENEGGKRIYAVLLMLVASLTDFLDGLIARKFQMESEFGRVIDPLADKICAGAVVIVLSACGDVPVWLVIAVIVRDTLILAGGLYIAKAKGVIYHSNWPGKLAMAVVAAYLMVATLRIEWLEMSKLLLLWASVAFLAVSLFLYVKRFYEALFSRPQVVQRSS